MSEKSNGQSKKKQFTLNEALGLITNHVLNSSYSLPSRARLQRAFIDPRRDLDDEVGYKKTDELTVEDYKTMYDREPVASRVVEVMPRESWLSQPTVYEDEDPNRVTPFEEAWDALGKSLLGAGFFQTEQGSPIWNYLRDADIKSGIMHYGGILLGIDDGKPLSEPVDGIDEKGQPSKSSGSKTKASSRKVLYLRTLDQSCMSVTRWQDDSSNPRYNMPVEYSITTGNQYGSGQSYVSPREMSTLNVHWSRVVHLADGGDVWAVPRMRPVFDRLCDIRKVCGSSGEMYYKGAFPGWSLEALPEVVMADQLSGIDTEGVKDEIEKWQNGLQRILFLKGLTMKGLPTQVVDPTASVMLYVKMICIQLAIPERIFMGSERGELASSQDKGTWNGRITARQQTYLTPRVIVPFVDRLILLGVLPTPSEYFVEWPDMGALTDAEKADIAVKRTDAMSKYIQGGIGDSGLMQPMDFLTRELGYEEEEATQILDDASDYKDDRQEEIDEQKQAEFDKQKELAEAAPEQPPEEGEEEGKEEEMDEEESTSTKKPNPFQKKSPIGNEYDDDLIDNKASLSGGRWVTVAGRHVYVKGGKVVAGGVPGTSIGSGKPSERGQSEEKSSAKSPPATSETGSGALPKESSAKFHHGTGGLKKGDTKTGWEGERKNITEFIIGKTDPSTHVALREGGELVGAASIEREPGRIHVALLATKRSGYGRKMMEEIAREASRTNSSIELEFEPASQKFYEKIGMKRVGKWGMRFSAEEAREFAKSVKNASPKPKEDSGEPEDGVFSGRKSVRKKDHRDSSSGKGKKS